MRWESDPLLVVEHVFMRFGGLVAVNDLSFAVGRGDITALIGPNGAGKTTVFNCITGFYKPTEGRMALARQGVAAAGDVLSLTRSGKKHMRGQSGDLFLLERMPDQEIARTAKVARTFQNIRLFTGMTVLENLLVAQHNRADESLGHDVPRLCSASVATRPRGERRRESEVLARQHRPDRPRRRPCGRPSLRRPAAAGDRPGHVYRPRPALPRRARGRPQPARVASSSTPCCASSATTTARRSC